MEFASQSSCLASAAGCSSGGAGRSSRSGCPRRTSAKACACTVLAVVIVGAIVAEFVGASEGLGYLLVFSVGQLDVDLMFAVLVVLSVISIVAFEGFKLFERWVAPWAVHDRTDLAR